MSHHMYLLLLTTSSVINLGFCWKITVVRQSSAPLKDQTDCPLKNNITEQVTLIFPGTKWCGSGNIAEDYNDLGPLESTDRCCRDHDNCVDIIEAGKTAHGLTNNGFFTKLNCKCDLQFLDCLKSDDTRASQIIGYLYFDGLNTQCFQEDYPIIGCATYYPRTRRCKAYDLNRKRARMYQFFDVPLF